uniref:Putative secreted protein n=1 Tax=Ixodes ricinus TaxID=34613 RepID=A0A6B0TUG8_IXORI
MRASSAFASGPLATGRTWWWTTGFPPATGACSAAAPEPRASSGGPCSRRPTPSTWAATSSWKRAACRTPWWT